MTTSNRIPMKKKKRHVSQKRSTSLSSSLLLLVSISISASLTTRSVSASMDPNSYHHPEFPHPSLNYGYSQAFELDFSSDWENYHPEDGHEPEQQQPQQAVEAAEYDGGDDLIVTSCAALMYSSDQQPTAAACLFYSDYSDDEDEDEDDDDDDEDDGHSSMLSNASLKRSAVLVGSSSDDGDDHHGGQSSQSSSQNSRYYTNDDKSRYSSLSSSPRSPFWRRRRSAAPSFATTARKQQRHAVPSSLWKLRGGATTPATATTTSPSSSSSSSLGSEVAKKLLVTALVTLVYEFCIGHVLEFTKIRMQTAAADDEDDKPLTYGHVLRDITAEKGWMALWDGFVPWGVIQAIFKGAVFGLAHATASGYLLPLADEGKIPLVAALTLAGGIGGGFQGYVLSPTLLLKTRVMTNPVFRQKMSALRTTWLSLRLGVDVVKQEGLATLMKGANVFATKRVFDWSTRFFFSDLIESLFLYYLAAAAADSAAVAPTSLTVAQKSLASLLGGVASTCCTLPLDVLVAKTQDAKKAGQTVSAWRLFCDELDEKGWSGLRDSYMRGFEARLLHVCTTTVAIKTGTPLVYDAIFGTKK